MKIYLPSQLYTVAMKLRWTANFHQDKDKWLVIFIQLEMAHQVQKTPEEPIT